jgi:predicted small secreted protein
MKKLLITSVVALASFTAVAKLPALSDEAKAKAAEAAAKTAWTGKVEGYLLCKSQDKVAASYFKTAKAAGKDIKPAAATPPCADPGAFVYTPPEAAKPIEAAGAHSPAATATSPPSTRQPDAVINPAKKS